MCTYTQGQILFYEACEELELWTRQAFSQSSQQ